MRPISPISRASTSRRTILAAAFLAPFARFATRPAAAQDAPSDAAALLRAGADALAAARSFHFALTTPQGHTEVLNTLELRIVEGDVLRPDRFRARIEATAAGLLDVTVTVIGIGDRLWISDPRRGGDAWIDTTAATDPASDPGEPTPAQALALLANPDLIFLAALSILSTPTLGPNGTSDGEPVHRVDGIVDLQRLAATATTAAATDLPPGLIPDPLPASIWFDAANRPRRIELEGPILPGEEPGIIRRLDLTHYDEPVAITPPPPAATPEP
ncbi:MAG: hypothetical protein ACR2J8_01630 [Thermomicrobiales bacterium]